MDGQKILAVCQHGGVFSNNSDGSLAYSGGEAHAISVSQAMTLDDFKSEITSRFDINISDMSIKYFLPGNKRTLITISNDKDLYGMVEFNKSATMVEVYILVKVDNRSTRNADADSGTSMNVISCVKEQKKQQVGAREIEDILIDSKSSPAASISNPLNICPLISNTHWDDLISGVGQEFDNATDFRDKISKYAISKGFIYKFTRNVSTKVTAICKNDKNCSWRIHASMQSHKQKFIIKAMNDVHTCGGGNGKDGQRRSSRQWLTSIIKEKLQYSPECKPKDIAKEIYENYGVTLSYHQVWRGKEDAQRELYSSLKETFSLLPWYCDKIMETNPGSMAILYTSVDSKFRRFFVSYKASLHGFEQGCRPLILLDRIPLKSSNQYKVLAATSVDGNDADFPIAFAVVEGETYDCWLWFLAQLRYALTKSQPITFISKWKKGLDEAVPQVFPDCHHVYCLLQLMEELKVELQKGPWSQQQKHSMAGDFSRAAQACTIEEFSLSIDSIRRVSNDIADWVLNSKPESWSDAFFKGARYDHLSTNIADSFSNWIPSRCESFIVQMVDSIQNKLMETMNKRRETSNSWPGPLTPSMDKKLQEETAKAHKLNVICSSDTVFEVHGNVIYVVNIKDWSCSCRRWQISGLPCHHAIAVFNRLNRSVYDYCSNYFKVDCYRRTYSELIQAIPEILGIDFSSSKSYLPPASHPPGQPRRKRFKPRKTNKPWLCSRCKVAGHNRATCEAVL